MHAATNFIVAIAVGAVVVVLFAGFANMIRGGNPNLSQKLMRWRVGLQFARNFGHHRRAMVPSLDGMDQIETQNVSNPTLAGRRNLRSRHERDGRVYDAGVMNAWLF